MPACFAASNTVVPAGTWTGFPSIVIFTMLIIFFFLLRFFVNCLKRTFFYACAAFQALRLIDFIRNFLFPSDRGGRTQLRADTAALADIRIDLNLNELLTYAGRTFLVDNVSDIFVPEVSQRAENRVWSCLPQTAQRGSLDVLRQSFQLVDVFQFRR